MDGTKIRIGTSSQKDKNRPLSRGFLTTTQLQLKIRELKDVLITKEE
jgi:hypothetical protein